MDLKPKLDWFLLLERETQEQPVFCADRPSARFPVDEVKSAITGRTILKRVQHEWNNITLDLPVRMFPPVEQWLLRGDAKNILLSLKDKDSHPVEVWFLQNARVIIKEEKLGRTVGIVVASIQISYIWAMRRV
jgi:hypothetical protein